MTFTNRVFMKKCMSKIKLKHKLSFYRFEFLLIALLLLIFDKIFFPNNDFYLRYVWTFNMIIISVACFGIFADQSKFKKKIRNITSLISISMPFLFLAFNSNFLFLQILTVFFALYYSFIFYEVMYQITLTKEVRLNVIIGSFCGFLLLSMISLFSYLIVELNYPNSFHGLSNTVPNKYNELSYFSFITLTSIGFGDIHPIKDMSRLLVAFFGMVGQFYMIAVVGIVISKFTNNETNK